MDIAALRALIMSVAAGLSTLIGALIIFISRKDNEKLVSTSLGFAAGIMLSVSFTDLFPNAEALLTGRVGHSWGVIISVALMAVGILLAMMLDKLVPHEAYDEEKGGNEHKNLFRVGFVSMLAIGLHNFPEGIATFMAGYEDVTIGLSITLAIALHNIPEGISVALPIYYSTKSKAKALKYTFISGIAEPLGAFLAFLVLRPIINDATLGGIFAIVAGIMIYIAVEELIPSSRQYGHEKHALIATLLGVCLMPLTHII